MPNVNPNFVYVSEEEKQLLIAISNYSMGGNHDYIEVSLPQLMLVLRRSRNSVKDLRVPCVRKGLLEIIRVGFGSSTSIYKLNVDVEHLRQTPAGLCFVVKNPQSKKKIPAHDEIRGVDESAIDGSSCGFWQRLMSSKQGDKR